MAGVSAAADQRDAGFAEKPVGRAVVDEGRDGEIPLWPRGEIVRDRDRMVELLQPLAGVRIVRPRDDRKVRAVQHLAHVERALRDTRQVGAADVGIHRHANAGRRFQQLPGALARQPRDMRRRVQQRVAARRAPALPAASAAAGCRAIPPPPPAPRRARGSGGKGSRRRDRACRARRRRRPA